MPFTPQTPIRGSARGTAAALSSWAESRGCKRKEDVRRYLETVYQLAPELGLNADVVAGQSILETSMNGAPWASHWWQERCNPAGIGITGDPVQNARSRDFRDGEGAARAHLLHLHLYVNGATVPTGFQTSEDPRWDAAIAAGFGGIVATLADLTNRWAVDDRYAEKIAARLDELERAELLRELGREPAPGPEPRPRPEPQPATGFVRHDWPGLDDPVFLPDWIDVEIKLIPKQKGWTSGIASNAHAKTTWHDTGNENSNADGEWTWANGGRKGADPGSYNGVFDDRKLIITQRFDELVGHARNNEGNRTSYAFEQAWGGNVDFAKSVEVGCAVHAAVCVAKGWEVDTALVQHHFWPRPDGTFKNCPGQIRRKNIWSQVVRDASAAAARVRGLAGESGPPPERVFADPSPIAVLDAVSSSEGVAPARIHDPSSGITFIWVGDRVRAAQPTGRFKFADASSDRVGPDIEVGEDFDVDFLFEHDDTWWYYMPTGARIQADDVERVSDTKG